MVKEIVTTLTQRGQLTVPAEVRRLLGVKPRDKVAFAIDGDEVRLQPARFTLESVLGSVDPLPGATTADFEQQIEEATEEAIERTARPLRRR